jgi:undecaprenyl-diphosphatase
MPLYQAVILAIVQGFTEFLPISSSAHLALAPWLLGWADQGLTFDIAMHFGTLLAVLIYFFRDWLQLLAGGFGIRMSGDPELRDNPRLLWMIAAATVPVGIAGLTLEKVAETTFRTPFVIGGMLIAVGLLMAYAEGIAAQRKNVSHIGPLDAMFVGFAQALAVVPGTSRSGITITAGLFRGLDRASAARFSFLLSTPAIGAAALKAFYDLYKAGGIPAGQNDVFLIGMTVSAITGCFVIAFFMRFLRHSTLRFFVVYRIVFGILVIALAFFRR